MKQPLLLLILLLSIGFLQSCSTPLMISVPVMRPSEINTNGYARAYVEQFTDSERLRQDGEHIRAMVIEELLYSKRVELVTAIQGKSPNVDSLTMIISGAVTDYSYSEKFDQQQSFVPRKVWYRDTAKKWRDSTIIDSVVIDYYRYGTLHIAVQFRISNAVTGALVGVRTIDDIVNITTQSRNNLPSPINPGLYDTQIRRSVVQNFLAKIFPYRVYESVQLLTESGLPELGRGNRFAQQGDWDYAIAEYRNAIANHKASTELHKAYYNLGSAYMFTAYFSKAEDNLRQAMSLAPDEQLYTNALRRLRTLEAQYNELQKPATK